MEGRRYTFTEHPTAQRKIFSRFTFRRNVINQLILKVEMIDILFCPHLLFRLTYVKVPAGVIR